jgi:hypothetical protein
VVRQVEKFDKVLLWIMGRPPALTKLEKINPDLRYLVYLGHSEPAPTSQRTIKDE